MHFGLECTFQRFLKNCCKLLFREESEEGGNMGGRIVIRVSIMRYVTWWTRASIAERLFIPSFCSLNLRKKDVLFSIVLLKVLMINALIWLRTYVARIFHFFYHSKTSISFFYLRSLRVKIRVCLELKVRKKSKKVMSGIMMFSCTKKETILFTILNERSVLQKKILKNCWMTI